MNWKYTPGGAAGYYRRCVQTLEQHNVPPGDKEEARRVLGDLVYEGMLAAIEEVKRIEAEKATPQ